MYVSTAALLSFSGVSAAVTEGNLFAEMHFAHVRLG
jgi:hypothetical protein